MANMEKLVKELERAIKFKKDTVEGDLVLVASATREPPLLSYAVVGPIERDETKRDEWWHVTLHLLGIPIQTVVWTLREPQFTGKEIFTMGGIPHFIRAVALPATPRSGEPVPEESSKKPARRGGLKLVK